MVRALVCILCLYLSYAAAGKSLAASFLSGYRGSVEGADPGTQRMQIVVSVTDGSGAPVSGLRAEDLTLADNQQNRTITQLRDPSSDSIHTVIVLDAINNSSWGLGRDRKAVEKFLSQGPIQLSESIALAIAIPGGVVQDKPTRDRSALLQQLGEMTHSVSIVSCDNQSASSDDGGTVSNAGLIMNGDLARDQNGSPQAVRVACLNEHFKQSLAALKRIAVEQENAPGRAVIIWIGPGWPLLSGSEFSAYTRQEQDDLFKQLVEITAVLRNGQSTLDVVSSPDFEHSKEFQRVDIRSFYRGTETANRTTGSSLALAVLAYQSGGRLIGKSKNLPGDIGTCLSDAEHSYVLSFDAARSSSPNEFHSVDLHVNRPGVTVRTITSYYSEK